MGERIVWILIIMLITICAILLIGKDKSNKKEEIQQAIDSTLIEYAVYDSVKMVINKQEWSVLHAQTQTQAFILRLHFPQYARFLDDQRLFWENRMSANYKVLLVSPDGDTIDIYAKKIEERFGRRK